MLGMGLAVPWFAMIRRTRPLQGRPLQDRRIPDTEYRINKYRLLHHRKTFYTSGIHNSTCLRHPV